MESENQYLRDQTDTLQHYVKQFIRIAEEGVMMWRSGLIEVFRI